jgi:hypothetical protein
MMTRQDIDRVKKIIQSIDPLRAETVLQKLPSLRTGEFLMLSPDVYDDVVNFQVRWLVTNHLTLDEKDIQKHLPSESKQFFAKYQQEQKKKDEKPVAPTPPSKALAERIQLFLNSVRQSVSAEYVAENLDVKVEDAENALNSLVRSKVVKKARASGGEETLYWLSKFDFKPSKNVLGEVLVIPARITQVEAVKRAKALLEGGLFFKKEEIYDAEFSLLPLWKVSATRKAKHLFFFRREELDTFYLSATTGAMISLEKNAMLFHRLMTKSAEKLRDLDDDEDITFIPKLPNEVQKLPRIKLERDKIYSTLRLTLGVKPLSAEVALLPVWKLKVRHKKKEKKRSIVMDAATGRILAGHFRPRRSSRKRKN